MKKKALLILLIGLIFSCKKENVLSKTVVAKAYDEVLTRAQLKEMMPRVYAKVDSVKISQRCIEQWALDKLLYKQALINLDDTKSLDQMVKDYKEQLYINQYKKALVSERAQQEVLDDEIETFYNQHKSEFRLNESLVKFKYIHIKNHKIKNKVKDLLKGDDGKKNILWNRYKKELSDYYLNDSVWVSVQNIYAAQPQFPKFTDQDISNTFKIIEKKSSDESLYLMIVQKYLKSGSIAPQVYVKETIKNILLHQHQLNFFKQIEKELLAEALKDKDYEKY